MKVVCCQLDLAWEDKAANLKKVRQSIAQTALSSGSLLVLPEMFATGFSMNVPAMAEPEGSDTEEFLRCLAHEHGLYVIGGLAALGKDGRARNQALAVSPTGEVLGRYNKIHPFSLGAESQYYMAGTEVVTFRCQEWTVAPFICYDLRFPELFRTAAARGAQLFPVIANWPVKRESHWVTLLQARAIENQAYVVGVNRCGADPKLTYPGRSLVIDPHGTIIADAGPYEQLLTAEMDLEIVETWRRDFPALRDRRWSG